MKIYTHTISYTFFLILLMLNTGLLSEIPSDSLGEEDMFINSLIEDFGDEPLTYIPHHPTYTKEQTLRLFTRQCQDDPPGIIRAQLIFRTDLYKFTNPINQRSIQDYPEFYFYSCLPPVKAPDGWTVRIDPFYNQTSKANYTKDGTILSSYLNINNPALLEDLSILQDLGFDIDIPQLLSIVSRILLEERRGGIMVGGVYHHKRWFFEARIPIIYQERNFQLTDIEQLQIQSLLGISIDDATMDFAREHLIADRLGFGDTRINIWRRNFDGPELTFDSGFMMTLPTAWAYKKGLYGSHFSKNMPVPPLDLNGLLNLAGNNPPDAFVTITNFLLGALDRLSRILLESASGNNGHVGLGAFIYYDLYLSKKFNCRTRVELEYLLPILERRFYIMKKDTDALDQLENPLPENCDKDVKTLEQTIINTLFPMGYNTMVYPGLIFKMTTALSGRFLEKWKTTFGWDIWWWQREQFTRIDAPKEIRENLRVDIARKPAAFQGKVFATIGYFKSGKWCDWSLNLYGDRTLIRSGIGKDFTLGFKFEFYA